MSKHDVSPPVNNWLKALGVESLCQWDVLVFLYRHPTSLLSAEHIAHLLGYPTNLIVGALDYLEPLGLLHRSRVSQGVRLYQFTVSSDPRRGKAFHELLALTDNRACRMLLMKALRGANPTRQNRGHSSWTRRKGDEPCLQAI